MSNLSNSVKFSDQPHLQSEKNQAYASQIDQPPLSQSAVLKQKQYKSNNNDEIQYQNSYYQSSPQSLHNYSGYSSSSPQYYSPHQAHHARMKQQQDIEKQFNYSGSKLRSPHHNPISKVQARLRQNLGTDSQYNSGYYRDQLEGEHCPEHCPHESAQNQRNIFSAKYNSNFEPKSQNKIMRYAQPIGAGSYTNQLEGRNAHAKTEHCFYNSGNKRLAHSSHNGARANLNDKNNSTTFNSIMQNKRVQERLREKLYFDERTQTVPKTTIKNKIVENIVSDGEVFQGNQQLMDSVYKLKSLNLLRQHESHVNRYSGVGKSPYVFNDYHTKSTNNGFSRQEKGGYYFTR